MYFIAHISNFNVEHVKNAMDRAEQSIYRRRHAQRGRRFRIIQNGHFSLSKDDLLRHREPWGFAFFEAFTRSRNWFGPVCPKGEISPTRVLTPSHITVMSQIRFDIFVRTSEFFYSSLPPMKQMICI